MPFLGHLAGFILPRDVVEQKLSQGDCQNMSVASLRPFSFLVKYGKLLPEEEMKKILILLLMMLAVLSCQKKEEPQSQSQTAFPPVQTADEIKHLQEIVAGDPKNLDAWTELGNHLMDAGRFQEAIDAYDKSLALDQKNVDVRVDMGVCYRRIGKPEIAVREFRKAIEFNPNHVNAHKNLAIVLEYDMRDGAAAAAEFQKTLDLDPQAPDAERIKQEIEKLKAAK